MASAAVNFILLLAHHILGPEYWAWSFIKLDPLSSGIEHVLIVVGVECRYTWSSRLFDVQVVVVVLVATWNWKHREDR